MNGYAIPMRTFEALLTQGEPEPILAFLNGMTDHRFTGLLEDERLLTSLSKMTAAAHRTLTDIGALTHGQ